MNKVQNILIQIIAVVIIGHERIWEWYDL